VAVSARSRQGLDRLAEAVIEMLAADFADAEIEAEAANGKLLAYLGAHADIYHQEFDDNRVRIRCHLPRHLLHHVHGPGVQVRFL
jgi:GTP-binding protein HflX